MSLGNAAGGGYAAALPRIHLFALGGTIAMGRRAEGGGVVPSLDAAGLIESVPELASVARLEVTSFRQLPGAHLRFEDLEALATAIEAKAAEGVRGVIVTQGTDTIEETAFALDRLVDADVAVVVTGAMRNPSTAGADGPANLLAAARVASVATMQDNGCLVVMNDEIHAARFVRKMHTSRCDAFASPDAGPVGHVVEGRVRLSMRAGRLAAIARASAPRVATHIASVMLALDDDGGLIRLAVAGGYTGVVVAAVGGGHAAPAAAAAIQDAAKDVDVVLASRAGAGEVLRATYGFEGSEIDLQKRGAICAGMLDAVKARVLLALLQRHGGAADIREAFAAY
ncbi:asparaginase [Ramlibacter sp.]|uniref:asparaginase n=1 Tax=Ramlibacter sp. TaxID=1917967 RepID=UPI003D0A21F6